MRIRILVLSCIIGALCFVAYGQILGDKIYKGTILEVNANEHKKLIVEADSVDIRAASYDEFIILTPQGTSLVGSETTKPLGWEYDKYYTAEGLQLSGGEIRVIEGEPTIQLANSYGLTIYIIYSLATKVLGVLMIVAVGAILWLIGFMIVDVW